MYCNNKTINYNAGNTSEQNSAVLDKDDKLQSLLSDQPSSSNSESELFRIVLIT